uniref:ribosomal protein S10 n=1 Tax=Microzonia abyssicola TaxID=217214 RepID=UPI002E77DE65|nr:ribosomal protein S10 [Syringoderma abyssicola]WBP70357.1 ribosomal protein S10 [Syringoderma abyssicola]
MRPQSNYNYKCKIWVYSTSFKNLKSWSGLLPLSPINVGLPTKIKRFTLLRSPLGNKTAKDQYERREYRSYFCIESTDASKILAFLEAVKQPIGVKLKIKPSMAVL